MTARYFFDVTDIKLYLKTHTTVSGIQRASLEVIRECVKRAGAEQVRLCLWDPRTRQYKALRADFFADMKGLDVDALGYLLYSKPLRSIKNTPPVLARYRSRPVKYHIYRMIAHIQAWRKNESYFAKRGSSLAEWQAGPPTSNQSKAAADLPDKSQETVSEIIQPGDQIIVLGAAWGMSGLDSHLQELHDEHGAEISIQVYDLIPLVMTQHLANAFALEFYRWLEKSTYYSSRYFACSENTRRDLERFMADIGRTRPITVIPLARQLEQAPVSKPSTSLKANAQELQKIPMGTLNKTKLPYVLVVGTLESRKNLWRLVQAWDRLTQETDLDMPRLILAGRRGWYNDDLMDWMDASGNLRGWVQFVESPTDEELAYLYRHCLFTATVSLYEGWGLPIGESLGFGKTAVVADNSSMPEVGGDLVEYCDANSITSIAKACRRLIADPEHRRALEGKIAQAELRGWDDVAADYVVALEKDE